MKAEALAQYNTALKAGQKYYKTAVSRGKYPYPLVLDEILLESSIAGYDNLGILEIPTDSVIGTRFAGRKDALAGNFMPLLGPESEFAQKWMRLCEAHLSDEGIRDPIQCFEYLGRFYIQEGNKRCSVLKSYLAPTIPASVTRVIPRWSGDPEIQLYYEFMHFYSLSRLYGVEFRHPGGYARLQAALGFAPEHIWSTEERQSFSAVFSVFQKALEKLPEEHLSHTAAEFLLVWLQLFPFHEIQEVPAAELTARLEKLLPDVIALENERAIELRTEPAGKGPGVLTKILNAVIPEHLDIAFLYSCPPEESTWVRAHDDGRKVLEDRLGSRVTVKTWVRGGKDYGEVLEAAIADGADVVFATDAGMISACRKAATLHPNVRFLNCAVFQPYTGVRMYNGRTYECKFITGAVAGAMTRSDTIGYVANNPIFGTPASVNAFALGARMTNPNARIVLDWACLPGDPVQRLLEQGVTVISNREIVSPSTVQTHFEMGTFRVLLDGSLLPLASPFWDWGELYDKIVRSIFSGDWKTVSGSQAINYWWGMASGVLDVKLSDLLPDGVQSLGQILKEGICDGSIQPFRTRMFDQHGELRNDGSHTLSPEEILSMDWFCDNVDGCIPDFSLLRPEHGETVRVLGLYRDSLLPEAGGGQL